MNNWIWYPGDFEIYHIMKQNFSREERGFDWPAYWYTPSWNHNVRFSRTYDLTEKTSFTVYAKGKGYVAIKRQNSDGSEQVDKFPFEQVITCASGEVTVEVIVCHLEGLPCIFVSGITIFSDESWLASNYIEHDQPIGGSALFTKKEQNPMDFPYTHEIKAPLKIESVNGSRLLDFGYDITAKTRITFSEKFQPVTICYGESKTEALDVNDCYLKQVIESPEDTGLEQIEENTYVTRLRAFRYIFLPNVKSDSITITADRQFVDFGGVSQFKSTDERLNQIWAIADRTFRTCSDIFFLDGVKRDKWVWSGDAYQSYFINQYSFFNKEIVERTILGLRGNDPFRQHLNTIIDYSLYWLISIEEYYKTFGDQKFLEKIYLKMESLLQYCNAQTDEHGFIFGKKGDWVYIDWAEFDISGPLCAEQMLLARAYQSVIAVRQALGIPINDLDGKLERLKSNIHKFYWDEEKGGFIDSYESGKRNVTKHANIFAILFNFVDKEKAAKIKHHVLMNPEINEIHTPYFKFWELEVMVKIGEYPYVIEQIKSYWGGMLDEGATTFWEYYDPNETGVEKYAMYGDKYGKSLCHAWGASPIYLIGRYLLGVQSTAPGYESFEVAPQVNLFDELTCMLPVGEGHVTIELEKGQLKVLANVSGGNLCLANQTIALPKGQKITIKL
ncbi:hypothetical protein [Neobacillus cucumis]|uniref:alpha-L-rhamnosidase-related protein n=1 Tax=Neobacillus cucumis TaxID=1740721 RepID=UPI002E203132|nr:hypothetical protein [Neobacillus cucumis]